VPNDTRGANKTAVLESLSHLESTLMQLELPAATIGHNNPPEPINDVPLTVPDVQELHITIDIIRNELKSPDPDEKLVENGAGFFKKIARKLSSWIAKTTDKLVVASLTAVASNYYSEIVEALKLAYRAIKVWLM
jgi:hypothetical protein